MDFKIYKKNYLYWYINVSGYKCVCVCVCDISSVLSVIPEIFHAMELSPLHWQCQIAVTMIMADCFKIFIKLMEGKTDSVKEKRTSEENIFKIHIACKQEC